MSRMERVEEIVPVVPFNTSVADLNQHLIILLKHPHLLETNLVMAYRLLINKVVPLA